MMLFSINPKHLHRHRSAGPADPLLELRDVQVRYGRSLDGAGALRGASLSLRAGTSTVLFGDSGSGKSTLALGCLRLLPAEASISGSIRFEGLDVGEMRGDALRRLRGRGIGLAFQDAGIALCPVVAVGEQIADVVRTHLPGEDARGQATALLQALQVGPARDVFARFPHQLSAGQRQRIGIALALAARPRLLIADEALAAVDEPVRAEVVRLVEDLRRRWDTATLWITHDPEPLFGIADQVVLLRDGRVAFCGSAAQGGAGEPEFLALHGRTPASRAAARGPVDPEGEGAVLRVRGLRKSYARPSRWRAARSAAGIEVLAGVDLDVAPREAVGLVGPSGAGKTTLARCLFGLEAVAAGSVFLEGEDVLRARGRRLRRLRTRAQMVFQDSARALDPRLTLVEAVEEPLRAQRAGSRSSRRAAALSLLERVGIDGTWAGRRSLELSGGQRQRVALARALVLRPRLLVLDEALSGLDRSAQLELCALIDGLRREQGVALLFITHDRRLLAEVADRAVVLDGGRLTEAQPALLQAVQR